MLLGTFKIYTDDKAEEILSSAPDSECQIENTGRLILPDRLLHRLTSSQPPFLFRLSTTSAFVHLGYPVFRSFTEDDGPTFNSNPAIVPSWAARQLSSTGKGSSSSTTPDTNATISIDCKATLSIVTMPTGNYIRLRPLEPTEVFAWANPTAILNKKLRHFACLSVGSVFSISYLDRLFHFEVKTLKPADAVCIIDCDMQLEFDFTTDADSTTEEPSRDSERQDVVLNDDRLLQCGVSAAARVVAGSSMTGRLQEPAICSVMLRDALDRARVVADTAARRWGAGVELSTGQKTLVEGGPQNSATPGDAVKPNLAYDWGSLNFQRPMGRTPSQQGTQSKADAASDQESSAGRGIRLKDKII